MYPTHPFRGSAASTIVLLASGAVACQSYEQQPLDLAQHMDAVAARSTQSLAEDSGSNVPESLPLVFDLADGASPAECEVLALFYNADLRIARQAAGFSAATRDHAGLWQDPVFGFDAAQVLSHGNDFEYGATASVTLPISGRLRAERDLADAVHAVELERIANAEWNVRAQVRSAYVRWAALEQRKGLLLGALAQMGSVSSIAGDLQQAGALSLTQSRLIDIEQLGREAELMGLELEADLGRIALLGLIGLSAETSLTAAFSGPSPYALPGAIDADTILANNTEVAVARARHRQSEEALRLEIRRQHPDLTVGLGPGGEGGDTRVLFGFSLPIPLLNRNAQAIAEARAARDSARVAAEVTLERIERDAHRSQVTLASLEKQRGQLERKLRPLLEEQTQNISQLAALGEIDAFLILESVRRHYDAAARLMDLEARDSLARIELLRLLGPAVPSTTTSTETEGTQP